MFKYNLVITISKSVQKDILLRSNNKLKPVIINNGVPVAKIKRRQDTFSSDSTVQLVQISRLMHLTKGQHILLSSVDILQKKYNVNNIHVNFIGDGPSKEYLTNLSKGLGLESKVTFYGNKERIWIYDHLQEFSILVQPSLFEGFGLTVVEGMAAKLPCLVSDIDGPIDIIENGKYGFSFHSEDANSLAEKIYNIIQLNKHELENKLNMAYEYCIENYSDEIMNRNYESSYLDLLKQK